MLLSMIVVPAGSREKALKSLMLHSLSDVLAGRCSRITVFAGSPADSYSVQDTHLESSRIAPTPHCFGMSCRNTSCLRAMRKKQLLFKGPGERLEMNALRAKESCLGLALGRVTARFWLANAREARQCISPCAPGGPRGDFRGGSKLPPEP